MHQLEHARKARKPPFPKLPAQPHRKQSNAARSNSPALGFEQAWRKKKHRGIDCCTSNPFVVAVYCAVLTVGRLDCASRREGFRAVQGTAPMRVFHGALLLRGRAARWV